GSICTTTDCRSSTSTKLAQTLPAQTPTAVILPSRAQNTATATTSPSWSTACPWCTSSSNDAVSLSGKHSTRSSATAEIPSGPGGPYSITCRSSRFLIVR